MSQFRALLGSLSDEYPYLYMLAYYFLYNYFFHQRRLVDLKIDYAFASSHLSFLWQTLIKVAGYVKDDALRLGGTVTLTWMLTDIVMGPQ